MNRGMRVLQTLALPLGYVTVSAEIIILYQHAGCQERNAELPEFFCCVRDRLECLRREDKNGNFVCCPYCADGWAMVKWTYIQIRRRVL